MMDDLLYKTEVYEIIGAAMEVYNELGQGFLEAVYQEALQIELANRGVPFVAQPMLPILYKGQQLSKHYMADLLVRDQIVVELKALPQLTSSEEAQLLNELKAANRPVGLLINFGSPHKLEWKRRVYTKGQKIESANNTNLHE